MMSILIAQYADELALSGLEAGALATAALAGTAIATATVGRYAERWGRKRVLIAGALLAIGTGLGYAGSTSLVPLLLIAFIGTVNPTSGDVSAFLPVEQAILGQAAQGPERVRTFAWYNVIGSLAGAFGALASGATVLIADVPGLGGEGAIRLLFASYAILGVGTLLLVTRLGPEAELTTSERRAGLGPSRRRVGIMAGLFGVDSFAGAFIVQSIIALYLLRRFDLDPATTGAIFFGAGFLQAVSFLISARLSNRFGLVNTMVFTHLVSEVFLVGVAFATSAPLAVALLLARSFLSQMDVPPRQALVVSVVQPEERAAAAAYTGLTRSLAATPGPAVGGAMLAAWPGAPFLACAALKAAYDMALWRVFRHVHPAD
jgi:MFS family permease